MAGAAAHISYRPPDEAEGWLELLVSGLTFDLCGLNPAEPMPVPPQGHRFGVAQDVEERELEALTIVPGRHISGGFAMIPIVQAMVGLSANIALPLNAEAVCWHPARTWMEPQYFSRIALNWLSGGAFPALGLTALTEIPGGVRSEGLAFFVGQELQMDLPAGERTADMAKLAVRFIDYVVSNGPFRQEIEFEGPDGEMLRVEPSPDGKLATVSRVI